MPVTEQPPLKLSAAAETAETFSASNPNSHQALLFPISAYQTKYQVEFSSRFEPLLDALPIKPPVFKRWTLQPNKSPHFELWSFSSDAAVEPKPPDDAPEPIPPPEPPNSTSNIGALFAAFFTHGGDHELIFSGA